MPVRTACRLAVAILIGSAVGSAPAAAQAQDATLYQRLGGYDVIATFVDDFFARFDKDAELAPFLGGINAASGARIRQNFVDFFCQRAGGPCLYNGRDMKSAHAGLPIRAAHFENVMRHFDAALDAQNVGAREKQEILALLRSLRADIVQS